MNIYKINKSSIERYKFSEIQINPRMLNNVAISHDIGKLENAETMSKDCNQMCCLASVTVRPNTHG